MEKTKTMLIRVDRNKLIEYNELCKKNGINKSQRFRNFIDKEIETLKDSNVNR